MMFPDPKEDGISHINIYSKGKTTLGKFLSNFANTPFECQDGKFESIEGYWYWLCSPAVPNFVRDNLRLLSGYEAKSYGKSAILRCNELGLSTAPIDASFKLKIMDAIKIKLVTNNSRFEEFKNSTLPFTHYYVMYGKIIPAGHEWLIDFFENFRKDMAYVT